VASGDPPTRGVGSGVTSPPICALARLRRDDGNWWRVKKWEG
jgi:hypothetical protein